jgi:HK97 family phage portal protein
MELNPVKIFKKRHEAKKSALKREITDIINTAEAESAGVIQNWDTTDQTQGRNQKVSYKTLEMIYKKESWVRAAVDAIQRTVTSNGFRLVTKDENDENPLTERETIRVMRLLTSPNPEDSFSDIVSEIAVDLHLYGDAYIEIVKDSKGIPIAIHNLYAPSIKILVNKHGTVLGYIQNADTSAVRSGNSKAIVFEPNEIVHFKLPNPGNEVYGLSPLESLSIPIETDLHAQAYNLTFFKNNATPKLHIDLGNCTLPQLKRTKEFFKREYLGNPHKTLITEGGVTVNPIGTKPADMEFLNQRKFSRDEILAVFGVPPMKVGITEDVNRASALEADKSFKADKIIPLQRMIANKINLCVISLFNEPRVKFEFVELDLRDAKEQADIDKLDIEAGIVTVNEVRKKRGLPPKEEEAEEVTEDKSKETVDDSKNLNFLNGIDSEEKSKPAKSLFFR